MKKIVTILFMPVLIIALAIIVLFLMNLNEELDKRNEREQSQQSSPSAPSAPEQKPALAEPISSAKSRILKKPFGIYITPQSSPVQPEKFTGYHTGTDFETTPEEVGVEVPVYAVCTGKVRSQEIVQGYGGVIIQDCTLDSQAVTVLYGHLNTRQAHVLSAGQELRAGEKIAVLAAANSDLSGGERKHLHLGVHKGTSVDLHGYVVDKNELASWLDAQNYL